MNIFGTLYSEIIMPKMESSAKIKAFAIACIKLLGEKINVHLSESLLSRLGQYIEIVYSEKGEVLGYKGDTVWHNDFILTGAIQYSETIDNKEIPFLFLNEGNCILSTSYNTSQPTLKYNVITLKHTYICRISRSSYEAIEKEFGVKNELQILFLEIWKYYQLFLIEFYKISKLKAENKLEYVLDKYHYLFYNISNEKLSEMLGITPETLSRLKNDTYYNTKDNI